MRSRFRVRLPTDYSEQTYASPWWIVRYPHQVRYRTAIESLLSAQPRSLLDYGAGDGKLLLDALEAGLDSETVVAYEPVSRFSERLLSNAKRRGLDDRIILTRRVSDLTEYHFDFIACLGVLEHMPLPQRYLFYDTCDATLHHGGRVLIDVPVETGPTLLVKAMGRVALKGRGSEYSARELLRLSLGRITYDPSRFDPSNDATWIQSHKGFDHRLLKLEIEYRFAITETHPTPVGWLPAPAGNQEVFITAVKD